MKEIYHLKQPKGIGVPILISVPHSGLFIPDKIRKVMNPLAIEDLDDADFYVDKLYDFALEMGMTMISATHHRWVIDLNRAPDNVKLYNDGRLATSLVPSYTFRGLSLYNKQVTGSDEIDHRLRTYYLPYHQQLNSILQEMKRTFGFALLWDAHSIRRHVPSINPSPFPDLILGTNEGASVSSDFIDVVNSVLENCGHTLQHNDPFKGGYITRNYGDPQANIHAIQLEMCKDLYLDEDERSLPKDIPEIRQVLISTFEALITKMKEL